MGFGIPKAGLIGEELLAHVLSQLEWFLQSFCTAKIASMRVFHFYISQLFYCLLEFCKNSYNEPIN